MSLTHQFAVINKESKEKYIQDSMPMVSIPDDLIQYMSDSLLWIYSRWNGGDLKSGISYYGFSYIEDEELKKLKDIIGGWKKLFELSPKQFVLTGNYVKDEVMKEEYYEKIYMSKVEIIVVLEDWENLCKNALENNGKLLHNGI